MRKLIPLIVVLAAFAFVAGRAAPAAHADWSDWGFASYGDCMGATNDWADCNDGGENGDDPNQCQDFGTGCPDSSPADDSGGGGDSAPAPPATVPAGTIAIYITDWPLFVWYDPSDGYYVPGWGDGEVVGCGGGCMTAPGLDGDVNYGECDNNTIVGICGEIDVGDASQLPSPIEGYLGEFAPQQEEGPLTCGASSWLNGIGNRVSFGGGISCQSPYGIQNIEGAACLYSTNRGTTPVSCTGSYGTYPGQNDLLIPEQFYICNAGDRGSDFIIHVAGEAWDARGRVEEVDSDQPAISGATLGLNC